ncbi:ribulose-phosphate 3-epimerase [Mesoplasma syrphidae]|uniref:Ribulose-phosphate 3-epimerase n=1 Tax=Mesoplasma syrphidae TaxID=225999 RepID=A0A2K9BMX4_9MOLU|nr:ribulose-phosphate 3-epimerase [Mesoplasma syrphidae]AUF83393.1 ribulose-phosphate 3-epimerase [Mesoplasma syrphidae]
MKKYTILPSVLSANFTKLESELKLCQKAEIEWIHYDVMDYDFVPNLTFGSKILADIKSNFNIKVDIHFMVKVKTIVFEDFFKDYLKTNPEMMTMHIEAMNSEQTQKFIVLCQNNGVKASLAISPGTDIVQLKQYLPVIDNVLVMTVEPGFGGQSFIKKAAQKIQTLADIRKANDYQYSIEVDGGINEQTSKVVKKYGVDLIVAGSYLFGQKNFIERAKDLIYND